MVITPDSDSGDPGSIPGTTSIFTFFFPLSQYIYSIALSTLDSWRRLGSLVCEPVLNTKCTLGWTFFNSCISPLVLL
jgi:hypothetical protein